MAKTIAPQVRALLQLEGIRTMGGGLIGTEGLHRELRALLAVARALLRVKEHMDTESRHPTTCAEEAGYQNCIEDLREIVDGPAARLSRSSGTAKGRP